MQKILLSLILFLLPISAIAAEGAFTPQWLKLLHYQKDGNTYASVIEKGNFYLTTNGKNDPEAEYNEAIRQFNEKSNLKKCEFPARFMVLSKEGKVNGNLDECEEYQKYLSDIQPNAVTLLFTDAYMNNPSSMFGHTLFRIDTKRKGTQLLAHGANFGADTGDEHGALYALKGLWGGYYGHFGLHPYYDVINLYNNIENRDIWEYELDFSDEELALFVAHMWEMKDAHIRYYFASKNCSYVLLLIIEAAKPDLDISSKFSSYTVPLETLKAVHNIPNLVRKTNYRPSRQSKLKYRAAQMNKAQLSVFYDIIKKNKIELNTLNEEERADVLETAYQYVQYQYVERSLELKEYRQKSFSLLKERSKIINQHQYFDELKEGKNPALAHETKQSGIIFGSKNGKFFEEISFKPVYNSLMEDSYGLLKGAEINMFDTKLRHYENKNKYVLQQLDLLNIKSYSGCDIMFSPISFEINAGIHRLFNPKTEQENSIASLTLSGGQSYSITKNLLIYILNEANITYSGAIRHNGYLGAGIKGGLYYNHDKWRLNAELKQSFATSYESRGQNYKIEAAYGLTRNLMLYTNYEFFNSKYHDNEEISFGIKYNF